MDIKAVVEKQILTILTLDSERVAGGEPSVFTTIRLTTGHRQPITGYRLAERVNNYYKEGYILSDTGVVLHLTKYENNQGDVESKRVMELLVSYTNRDSWTEAMLRRLNCELDHLIIKLQLVPV